MSSYLSFFIVPKRKSDKEPKKHIILAAYSKNSDIYQYFDESIHPVWSGNEEKYTTLTSEDINYVLKDLSKDIDRLQKRLTEYEKYAKDNPEYIDDILALKESIQDLSYWKSKVSFLADILDDIPCYQEIEEICCNLS